MTTMRQRKSKFQRSRPIETIRVKRMSAMLAEMVGMHGSNATGWTYSFRPAMRVQLRNRYTKCQPTSPT